MIFDALAAAFAPSVDHPHPPVWEGVRAFLRITTTLAFDLRVWGGDYIPAKGGAIVVSNHQSNLDPIILAVRVRRPMWFFAKAELFEKPWFARVIREMNAFPVRRGEADISAVKEAIRRVKEGQVLTVFPEGTRTRTGAIGPIQGGITTIIRRAEVPVIPVVIEGSHQAWPRGRKLPCTHPIRILYGPPMRIHDYAPKDIVDVLGQTLRTMQTVVRARAEMLAESR